MSLAVLALVDEDSVDRLGVTVRISGGDIWGGELLLDFTVLGRVFFLALLETEGSDGESASHSVRELVGLACGSSRK